MFHVGSRSCCVWIAEEGTLVLSSKEGQSVLSRKDEAPPPVQVVIAAE